MSQTFDTVSYPNSLRLYAVYCLLFAVCCLLL